MLKDKDGNLSLRRDLALIGSLCLFSKLFSHESSAIIDACLMIVLIGIGGSVAEKFKKD